MGVAGLIIGRSQRTSVDIGNSFSSLCWGLENCRLFDCCECLTKVGFFVSA